MTAVLSLLYASVGWLVARIPQSVLGSIALSDEPQRAETFAHLQVDAGSSCEALCIASIGYHRLKRDLAAGRALQRAEELVPNITSNDGKASSLAKIATAALEIGRFQTYEQAISRIRTLLERGNWPAAILARDLGILGSPDYLVELSYCRSNNSMYEVLAIIAKRAALNNNSGLLDAVVNRARKEKAHQDGLCLLAESLTEVGRLADAVSLTSMSPGSHNIVLKAIAKAAGRNGDTDTIERAASFMKRFSFSGELYENRSEPLDLIERIECVIERVLRRLLGDWEKPAIIAAGVEALADQHPKQAQALWSRIKSAGRWRMLLSLLIEDIDIGIKTAGKVGDFSLLKWWGRLSLLSRDKETLRELIPNVAVGMAWSGRLDEALKLIKRLGESEEASEAMAGVAEAMARLGRIDDALRALYAIPDPYEHSKALEKIADVLDGLPNTQAQLLQERLVKDSRVITELERLPYQDGFSSLICTLAMTESVSVACAVMEASGAVFNLSILIELCKATVKNGDSTAARVLLKKAEQVPNRVVNATALSQMSTILAEAALSQKQESHRKEWQTLARCAFELGLERTNSLKDSDRRFRGQPLTALVRTAGILEWWTDFERLYERVRNRFDDWADGIYGNAPALIEVSIGLAKRGQPEKFVNIVRLNEIDHPHFRAQATAEVAHIVSTTKRAALSTGSKFSEQLAKWHLLNFSTKKLLDDARDLALGKLSRFQHPEPHPVARVTEILAEHRRYEDITLIVQNMPRVYLNVDISSWRVTASAARALARFGQTQTARDMVDTLGLHEEASLVLANIAAELACDHPTEAIKMLDEALRHFKDTQHPIKYSNEVLKVAAEAACRLPSADSLRIVRDLLRWGQRQGRRETIYIIGVTAPAVATMVEPSRWRETIEKLINTDQWWL